MNKPKQTVRREPRDRYISAKEIIATLDISKATFYGYPKEKKPGMLHRLLANGLKVHSFRGVRNVDRPVKKYLESSLWAALEKMHKSGHGAM